MEPPSPKGDHGSQTVAMTGSFKLEPAVLTNRDHKIFLQDDSDANGPIPQVSLRKVRFLGLVLIGVGATGAGLACFLNGITIERGIFDPIGSSANADSRVELFQTLSGFVWAAVGLLLEEYFKIFIAVMLIYFINRPWFPGDNVVNGPSSAKLRMLFWFTPLMMYVVNIGLSSVFVEHKIDEVVRAFADADLVDSALTIKTLSKANKNSTSVVDTVLRKLVTNLDQPFQINETSICSTFVNGTNEVDLDKTVLLPNIIDLQSTSVTFAFPGRSWNLDALPESLTPTHSVTIDQSDEDEDKATQAKLEAFLAASSVSYKTIGELLIQGLTLHGKATTDSNMFETYSCDPNSGAIDDDATSSNGTLNSDATRVRSRARAMTKARAAKAQNRRLQKDSSDDDSGSDEADEDGEEDDVIAADDPLVIGGMTVDRKTGVGFCYGMGNYLEDIVDLTKPRNQHFTKILDSIYGFAGIAFSDISATIETYEISPQLNLTTLTLDLPYDDDEAEYAYVNKKRCNLTTDEFLDPAKERKKYANESVYLQKQEYYCSGRYVAVDDPYQMCGEKSCLLEDYSSVAFMNKQVQIVPYMTNCGIGKGKVTYDPEVSSWFPSNCTTQKDSAFLYGAGSYFTGDFSVRGKTKGPIMTNTRRHYVLTFAKLDWRFEDLSKRFGASCAEDADGCRGLVHGLQNVQPGTNGSRVLIVGEKTIPQNFQNRTLKNPVPLVVLREPKVYNDFTPYTYLMYEYLDFSRLNTTHKESDGLGLSQGQCSLYVDAYLNHVKNNHYYIQDPRQPLYTSALYYLFQDAQIRQITLPKSNKLGVVDLSQKIIGTTRMNGDQEMKEIRFSIPLVSALSTCTGMIILVVYMAVIIKWPRDAVKLSDQANPAAQYADILIDEYPERVHTRRLRLANGSVVEMDDYTVQQIIFRNIYMPETPVVMH